MSVKTVHNMQLNYFDYYVIGINLLGFLLFAVNTWLYRHTHNKEIDKVITIVSFFGGSFGIAASILIFARGEIKSRHKKEIMMSIVFVFSMLVIQIIIFLIIKGHIKNNITVNLWAFFDQHRIFLLYLIMINVITLIAFGIDKINAIKHWPRIRIVTLLSLAFIGGSIGALIGMQAFRHKTSTDYFYIGVPLIIIMQAFVIFFLMNGKI